MLDTGWVVEVGMVDRTGVGVGRHGSAGIIDCGHLVYIYRDKTPSVTLLVETFWSNLPQLIMVLYLFVSYQFIASISYLLHAKNGS